MDKTTNDLLLKLRIYEQNAWYAMETFDTICNSIDLMISAIEDGNFEKAGNLLKHIRIKALQSDAAVPLAEAVDDTLQPFLEADRKKQTDTRYQRLLDYIDAEADRYWKDWKEGSHNIESMNAHDALTDILNAAQKWED